MPDAIKEQRVGFFEWNPNLKSDRNSQPLRPTVMIKIELMYTVRSSGHLINDEEIVRQIF